MGTTERVCDYVARLDYADLPPATVMAAKSVTLDLLGVAVAAARYPVGEAMNAYVRALDERGSATVLGTDIRTSPSSAALANGTLSADMELDDVHSESNLHASSVFVPALLAVGETADVTGRDWITALVASYEVGCRLSIALDSAQVYAQGFHPTAVAGCIGAAAGAARLLGGDADLVERSLGLAGVQASGLLTWQMEEEHFSKSFQSGVAARNAVVATELAARGYAAPPGLLDEDGGFLDAFSPRADPARMTTGLGESFEIERTGYKFYGACRNIHSTLDVVLELANEVGFDAGDVDRIEVVLATTMAKLVDDNALTTHNLQYVVAAALTDGEVGRAQTSTTRRRDPRLLELASRVELSGSETLEHMFPRHLPTQVRVCLTEGSVHERSREDPRGAGRYPIGWTDIVSKFEAVVRESLSPDKAARLIDAVDGLESLPSLRSLSSLLATDSQGG